jgi:hypothetical protein
MLHLDSVTEQPQLAVADKEVIKLGAGYHFGWLTLSGF